MKIKREKDAPTIGDYCHVCFVFLSMIARAIVYEERSEDKEGEDKKSKREKGGKKQNDANEKKQLFSTKKNVNTSHSLN